MAEIAVSSQLVAEKEADKNETSAEQISETGNNMGWLIKLYFGSLQSIENFTFSEFNIENL